MKEVGDRQTWREGEERERKWERRRKKEKERKGHRERMKK